MRIALIGFGEAGSLLGADLVRAGCTVRAYDLLFTDPVRGPAMTRQAAEAGVACAATLAEALRDAEFVISAVTAASSTEVARVAAALLRPGQTCFDINSVAPATKQENARLVEASGAGYIEAAVMAAIPPQRLLTPMLLGGRTAASWEPRLRALGMNVTAVSERIGVAAGIKLCRSIMIKGMEALTVSALLAARKLGVEQPVLESLDRTWPAMGWLEQQPDYLISRVAEHGVRRAAELREVAAMLESLQALPVIAEAIAEVQESLVSAMQRGGIRYATALDAQGRFDWRSLADRLAQAGAGRERR